jgi:hypothetical protein
MSHHVKTAALALVGLAVAGGAAAETATKTHQAPPDAASVCVLVLADAVEGAKPLTVYLDCREGAVRQSFATAVTFNRAAHEVDASGLKLTGKAIEGKLKVTIHPDAYVPADGESVSCAYAIEAAAKDGRASGTYRGRYGAREVGGAVAGKVHPRAATPEPARFVLTLEGAIADEGAKGVWKRRAVVRFAMEGGKAAGGSMGTTGSPTYAVWTGEVHCCDVTFPGDRLRGAIRASVRPGRGGAADKYIYAIDAKVIAGVVAGRFVALLDGKPAGRGTLLGTVTHLPTLPPTDSQYVLSLHEALPGGKMLKLHVDCREGRFRHAFGFSPTFNRERHDVDASGLRAEGGKLTGKVAVTINPDPWVPPDHKPVSCAYVLDAAIEAGTVRGRFEGTCGGRKVAGRVDGDLHPRPGKPAAAAVWLKFEDGLTGGNGWQNRAFVRFTLSGGKAADGRIFTNKPNRASPCWRGRFDGADVRFDGEALSGALKVTILSGKVTKGAYEFLIDGRLIGGVLGGSFRTRLGGRIVKTGTLVGSVAEAQ